MNKLAFSLILFVWMFSTTSCDASEEFTVEEITGTWLVKPELSYARFNKDGTYTLAFTLDGLDYGLQEQGNFTLEGSIFTYISNEKGFACDDGERGIYIIEPTSDGGFWQIYQEDECSRRGASGTVELERITE
jgi:hypothetical protein